MSTEKDTLALLDQLRSQITAPVGGNSTEKTILVSGDARRRLEQLFGRNITTEQDLVRMVEKCVSVTTGDVQIELAPFLLDRLQSRAIRVPFDQFLKTTVKRLLEQFAGIR